MIVLDSSAAIELLLGLAHATEVAVRVRAAASLHSPHLLDIEVTHVVRRMLHLREVDAARSELALTSLVDLPIVRHPHVPLIPRIWSLRSNLSAYDATYVALAESLGATLLTKDARLARAAPPGLEVIVIPA